MSGAVLLLWSYLNRLAARFDRLLAGGGRVRAPRPPRSGPDSPVQSPKKSPARRLPGGFAWLLRLGPEMAAYGGQLQYLMADPDMVRVLERTPRAARMLRPLLLMLGQADPRSPAHAGPAAAPAPPVAQPVMSGPGACGLDLPATIGPTPTPRSSGGRPPPEILETA